MPRVHKNAMLKLNGVDLSGHVQSLTLNYEAESLDASAMGVSARVRRGGLFNPNIDVTMFQNTTCVEETIFSLIGCAACVEVRTCNACSSDSNPRYQGMFHVQSAPPMTGAVGSLLTVAVRLESAGDLSRNIAVT